MKNRKVIMQDLTSLFYEAKKLFVCVKKKSMFGGPVKADAACVLEALPGALFGKSTEKIYNHYHDALRN